jgi:hypothetical protein
VIVTAVTEDIVMPMPKVPEVLADHVPMWVFAVEPLVVKDAVPELVFVPADAAFHVIACRA